MIECPVCGLTDGFHLQEQHGLRIPDTWAAVQHESDGGGWLPYEEDGEWQIYTYADTESDALHIVRRKVKYADKEAK